MSCISDLMRHRHYTTGSVHCYLHQDAMGRDITQRTIIPLFRWTQLWFLMRELLKKEGVHALRYASTFIAPR